MLLFYHTTTGSIVSAGHHHRVYNPESNATFPPPDLLEDDINPFINPDEESDVDIATSCVADTAGLGSIVSPSIPVSESGIASWLPAADIGEDRPGIPLPRAPVRSQAKRKHPLKLNRRLWEAPGPSPLSQTTFDLTAMAEEEYSSSSASVENLGSNDDEEEEFLRSFVRQHHLLKIHHLPRNFAGKKGRVAVSLWRTHLKRTLLSRIYELGVESPELDFVDEHSIEFLLDLQADLRRGHVTIPRLSTCNFAPPPSIGTSRRRVAWRAGQTFPRRVEDYSKAAARMLARHRALASI